MSLKAFLTRLRDDGRQTLGALRIYDDIDKIFECVTLEPAWKNNQPRESCIPTGTYQVVPRESPKFGNHFWIRNVPGREWVLFHAGNFRESTEGCVLVGKEFGDINKDGRPDLVFSRVILGHMLQVVNGRQFSLVIS